LHRQGGCLLGISDRGRSGWNWPAEVEDRFAGGTASDGVEGGVFDVYLCWLRRLVGWCFFLFSGWFFSL